MHTVMGRLAMFGSPGQFLWGGAYHATYWADPKEKIVAVLMTQFLPADGSDLHEKFRGLVYQAILAPVGTAPSPRANKPRRTGNTQ
jgi:CubicO group peptidase (beta-lactamase class C family)